MTKQEPQENNKEGGGDQQNKDKVEINRAPTKEGITK